MLVVAPPIMLQNNYKTHNRQLSKVETRQSNTEVSGENYFTHISV